MPEKRCNSVLKSDAMRPMVQEARTQEDEITPLQPDFSKTHRVIWEHPQKETEDDYDLCRYKRHKEFTAAIVTSGRERLTFTQRFHPRVYLALEGVTEANKGRYVCPPSTHSC